MPDVQVQKPDCFVDVPFTISDSLLAKTREQAPQWDKHSDKQVALRIAGAIPTATIKKKLKSLKEKNDPTAMEEVATKISLMLPQQCRASIPVILSITSGQIQVHPNYEKPQIKTTKIAHA